MAAVAVPVPNAAVECHAPADDVGIRKFPLQRVGLVVKMLWGKIQILEASAD